MLQREADCKKVSGDQTRLKPVPEVFSSNPLGFCRDMLSEISLLGNKDSIT